jgi:hypothetical protein
LNVAGRKRARSLDWAVDARGNRRAAFKRCPRTCPQSVHSCCVRKCADWPESERLRKDFIRGNLGICDSFDGQFRQAEDSIDKFAGFKGGDGIPVLSEKCW